MRQYIYPQNLKAQANLWLWKLRDIAIIGIALLISIFAVATVKLFLTLALTLVYAFLTIQLDDVSIMDFIKRAVKFFISNLPAVMISDSCGFCKTNPCPITPPLPDSKMSV